MKLIFAVVNGDDSQAVAKALTKRGFFATKLASTGGFLSAGNTTFLICTEDENVDKVVDTIKEKSHKRKQFVPSAAAPPTDTSTGKDVYVPTPYAAADGTNCFLL